MFVLCLPRKINSQVKLKLFVVAKTILHRSIWFAWTQVLLAMSMLFYLVWNSLSYFMQILMRRKKMTRMQGQDVCDWKDFEPYEFLTFYVGNLQYNANCYEVKKAIQEAISLKTVPSVDQVVITKKSKGESQGSAFVTVRWDSYMSINYRSITAVLKQGMKFLKSCVTVVMESVTTLTRTMNSCKISSIAKLEGHATAATPRICGRWVFVKVPSKHIAVERRQSQGVHRVLESTTLLSIVFDMQFSIIMTWWLCPEIVCW